MVMEFMDGEALSSRIHQCGRLTAAQVYPIAVQMLEGLGAAHSAGIIHRDLKPDNVYLVRSKKGQTDFVKLLDFGISKFNALGGEFSMTRTGAVMGTPYYMAPEQAKGAKDIDTRVDIYAAGVILYEAVSGQVPFNADTFNELIFKIVLESPPPVEQVAPGLDAGFAAIISKAMARDLNQRFASCADFLAALNAWAQANQPQASHQVQPSHSQQAAHVAAAPRPVSAATMDVGTKAAWSNTQGDSALTPAPSKKNTGVFVAIGAAAVLLLGGGGVTAYKLQSASKAAAAQAAQVEKDRLEAERKAKEELAKLEAEKKRAFAERAEAEQRAAVEKQRAEDQGKALELAKQAALESAQAAQKPVAAPPRPRTNTSAPKPETTARPKTGSRQIRTSL